MRPKSIIQYDWVFLAMIVIGVAASLAGWDRQIAGLEQKGLGTMSSEILGISLLLSTLVFVLLWYFIARRASVIAKWIYVVLVVLSAGNLLREMLAHGVRLDLVAAFNIVGLVLMLVSAALLFRPDARAWLGRGGTAVQPLE